MKPLDRAALRELAERASVAAVSPAVVLALLDALDAAERDLSDVHALLTSARVADPQVEHPDESYALGVRTFAMTELLRQQRVSAERERDEARADVRKYGGHDPLCFANRAAPGGVMARCDCGYDAALARAEGRG